MALEVKLGDKLYVIVRNDLSPGSQAVQGMHAMRNFISDFPDAEKEWFLVSNHIAFLQIENEIELTKLVDKLSKRGMRVATFCEPDLSESLTAIATDFRSKDLIKHLKLALAE